MAQSFDLILRNGMVVTPNGTGRADIAVSDGRIRALGSLLDASAADEVDLRGLTVLPGIIDTQVHFREPGLEHKEDLESGTRAAAQGGVVAIFEMPNTKPSTTTADAIRDKLDRAQGRAWVDHAFFIGAASDNIDHLAEWERIPGCAGIKVFMGSSTGNLLVADDETLGRVLAQGFRRIAVHCEDEGRLIERKHVAEDGAHPRVHHQWRDVETALMASRRLVALAEKAGRRVHVLHVTTAEEMEFLAGHKDVATVETTPQHLTLAAPECYERLGTYAQMNPPIRGTRHRDALWKAIADGVVDVLGSDHAPHTREEKDKPYPQSPSGMTGVQTLVPLMLDHVNHGRLSLERLVDLTSAGPARIYNIAGKGRIAVGYDADFTVVDMKAERTITNNWIESRCGWTPFDGQKVTGWPVATIVRGRTVMRDGQLLGQASGEPVRFQETL
ncbi:dihydroorotase [Paramagnetospirillum magneticum]|uniref:Dihydroorotase and related cyclic amidohydrolase n=1 Tax=Paramagnetospirillum magneticum (strain ATCC 700264 / AMB-1) TaxID=342108 RepID=Q2W7V6_PARM1|nr:dihydroorotase [Paramagnetospirillum magneticum]BAE50069.1 Dihydroorotase and related cyclic amidohydrolase [Paramagnetospirillum magneticum AMB-1]